MASESLDTHGTVNISMVLEVGGRGATGLRIIRNIQACYVFHGFESALEVNGWLQNHKKFIENCHHLHGFESWRERGGWAENHSKSIGLSAFSWFGNCGREGGGWPQNHKKCTGLL